MSGILGQIDKVTAGLCECGCGQPLPLDGPSAYFADIDCQRRWHEAQTDRPGDVYAREDAAPHPRGLARWRPDLVAAAEDDDLTPIIFTGCGYTGRFHPQIFRRAGRPNVWHLRLDDGHRYVGVDIDRVIEVGEPFSDELRCRIVEAWRRLERELTNPRRTEPDDAPALSPDSVALRHFLAGPTRSREEPAVGRWQRRCPDCRRHGVPEPGMRVPPTRTRIGWNVDDRHPLGPAPEPEPCQLCPHCHNPYPGPPLQATARWDRRHLGILLRVAAEGPDRAEASAHIPEVEVLGVYNPGTYIQQAWDRLNEQVTATARVSAWLRANEINPRLVPEDSPIATTRAVVGVDQLVTDEDGAIVCDENGPRRTARQVPLVEPWPDDLHHWNHVDVDRAREVMRRSADQVYPGLAAVVERLRPLAEAFSAFDEAFRGVAEGVRAATYPPVRSGRVFIGPVGADPNNPDEWQELGVAGDDGLTGGTPLLPIVNRRDAGVLTDAGLRDGQHFHVYPDPPAEPARHPLLAAIESRRNRNTGPPADRLDGRRRHRR